VLVLLLVIDLPFALVEHEREREGMACAAGARAF
jgi:hypothetical protein